MPGKKLLHLFINLATITEIGPELTTPQRIASEFTEELEAAFNDVRNDPNGHFVLESDITIREVEVQNIEMQELVIELRNS